MVSELEEKIRELDDSSKRIIDLARELAPQLHAGTGHIRNILIAKRKGFSSSREYFRHHQVKRGFKRNIDYANYKAQRNGFKNFNAYKSYLSMRSGFKNNTEYIKFLQYKKKGLCKNLNEFAELEIKDLRFKKQNLMQPEYLTIRQLDNLYSQRIYLSEPEIEEQERINNNINASIKRILNNLDSKTRRIIIGRFYENSSLADLGKELHISREMVRLLEDKALNKLYFSAKEIGLYELYLLQKDLYT